ncbi:MAG: hypothetical protein AAF573_15295 [Bacteroidota bacterium]
MKKPLCFYLLAFFTIGFSFRAQADTAFIYGKVSTFLGDTYVGQIRWGDEEAFWTDRFNANKVYNDNIDFLSDSEILQLKKEKQMYSLEERKEWSDNQIQNDKSEYTFLHQFSCQFGEIKTMKLTRWQKAELILRDGSKVTVSGTNTNDMNMPITIYDGAGGKIKIEWMEISQIEFLKEPGQFKSAIGEPLYGTVYTSDGPISGTIEWDRDERVTSDELDGKHRTGKFKAAFAKIKAIQPHKSGSLVTMESGERVYVFGTNDVNSKNRGIIVTNDEIGHVNVNWENFERVEFLTKKKSGKGYSQFKKPSEITGKVKMKDGKSLRGKIVFDLDEQFDYEVLNGATGKMMYEIPFRNIKRILPHGDSNCTVELKTQKKIKLRDSQDVSFKNEGLLVFENTNSTNPIYISWREVEEVVFN